MTGKVKCTCGWSWNKSDSSKKDMYICHECGRDNSNNMKDGGWLDNYNDSEVSLPEGFVGEGTFNGPKFSSPAWGGQFQMGGNLPGAVGNMYARTGAPSKGPRRNQTDVTDASAQNGKEMQYYQNGLDFTPKSISKNGAWLDNYEEAQTGKNVKFDAKKFAEDKKRNTPLQKSIDKEAQSEDNRRWTDSKEYKDEVKANKIAEAKAKVINDKATIQDRKDRIKNSVAAQKKSFTKDNWRQQLADETQAIGDKFRMFPEDPDSFIDEWMNPGVMIGNMASDLGSAPLRAQQEDSYMPYATSIGVPLLTGGLEGIGAKTTKQFVSNLINPLNIVPGYRSAEKAIGNKINKVFGKNAESVADNINILPPRQLLVDEQYFGNTGTRNALNDVKSTQLPSNVKLNDLREAINSNELWKYPGVNPKDEILRLKNAAKSEADIAYINSLEREYDRGLGNQWSDISARQADPVFLTGQSIEDLEKGIKSMPEGQQWSSMTEYKTAPDKGSHLGYIGDEADYIHDPKFKLPGNRFDRDAMMKDFQMDAGDSFNRTYSNHNWKPNIKDIPMNKYGGIIKDDRGQWDHPGEITEIGSNEITMEGVPYDVLGVSDTGDTKLMKPGKNYKFKGKKVTEYPMAKNGVNQQDQKTLQQLDQLTNFTNYNKPQPGGWLNKYN